MPKRGVATSFRLHEPFTNSTIRRAALCQEFPSNRAYRNSTVLLRSNRQPNPFVDRLFKVLIAGEISVSGEYASHVAAVRPKHKLSLHSHHSYPATPRLSEIGSEATPGSRLASAKCSRIEQLQEGTAYAQRDSPIQGGGYRCLCRGRVSLQMAPCAATLNGTCQTGRVYER